MAEREALKRQIELLQNLINTHKSIHGDAPSTGAAPTQPETSAAVRGLGSSGSHQYGPRGGPYAPQTRGNWRKTYSLRNKSQQASSFTSVLVHQAPSQSRSDGISLPSRSRGTQADGNRTSTLSSGVRAQPEVTGIRGAEEQLTSDTLRRPELTGTQQEDGKRSSGTTGACLPPEEPRKRAQESQQGAASRHAALPERGSSEVPPSVPAGSSASSPSSCQQQSEPPLTGRTSTSTSTSQTVADPSAFPIISTKPALPDPPGAAKHLSSSVSSHSQSRFTAPGLRKSKFTWIKSQNQGRVEPEQVGSAPPPPDKVEAAAASVSKAVVAPGNPSSAVLPKKTPLKKFPRKCSPVSVAPKTSKYKWVSSAGPGARTSRRPSSPKAWALPQRSSERGDSTRKPKPASAPSARLRKGGPGSAPGSSLCSRYRWKAAGQSTAATAAGAPTSTPRRSAFHWAAERSSKGTSPSSSSPGGFKLRSRMKIIRRTASSGGGAEKGSGPPAVRFSPRSRTHAVTRSHAGVRRTPPKELVSFGKHKLRRLSPALSRTSSAPSACSSHRSPASLRVYRTRYKMVTRPGAGVTHAAHYNPALTWRAKRIQSARSFLQSRLRAPHERHPPPSSRRWTGSSMTWIGGSLYRVSANKLSRTATASMSINRTGRYSSGHVTPPSARPSNTRHLASRAVQRSIAIMRLARQKKPQKQYCMYYNRFGRCNRGTSCPFIHDPDKVAVCTRFLRGTCKQAEGVCPFSHKVAKEKMPVCSYFLKGICNNSDCPYSHVYVSRKAEVCEDFVRGYCPEGEKCKKKHTLVCPDFSRTGSCPRGSRCKLQHRQRAARSASGAAAPAKRTRSREPPKRPRLSVVIPPDAAPQTPPAGPLSLPSFISLSSSPEEADAPDAQPADATQVKEKKLQIRPRL
ncbi:zinc finger CCCH domain-containing protein 3 [Cololabis saira]|uniref:zinc finger CCCH domain-containing protein 3 n=1 Tax=Cololabis saira TaxID=129043 RepID=UPI002AD56790|nr:zinc finger CCCH domain-containing protein 3 [Cololabis saira]